MVDTLVSGASASRRVGSTPISGTWKAQLWLGFFIFVITDFFVRSGIYIFTETRTGNI